MTSPTPFPSTAVLRASEQVMARTTGPETVLLNLTTEEFFGLDGVGARTFELLATPRTFDEVVAVLLEEYDVQRDELAADLTALLSELVDKGLVLLDG